MTLKAYLDNIEAKTGKTPKDFRVLAEEKGFLREGVKTGQIVSWLKQDFGLGQGHAMAIVLTLKSATQPKLTEDERVAKLFRGERAKWRKSYDQLLTQVSKFGPGVSVGPTDTYISLLRNGKKFAIVQVTADHFDIGIKLKGAKTTSRFQAAGAWNSMVTHRVRIDDPKQIDAKVLGWLKQAFGGALSQSKKAA
jgi:Domain of unknown function (DUF4287)/Domain of unknown function (DUF5655)